jgi:hypothetical protein
MSAESFTVPEPDVRRVWRWHWAGGVVGVAIAYFVRPGASLFSLVGSAALVGGVVYFAYRANLRRVWVTLTEEGMRGRDQKLRELAFKWDEAVLVEDGNRFGFKGVVIGCSKNGEKGMRKGDSLFIPAPVLELASFGETLARVAPLSHPLRTKVDGAI